MLKAEPVNCSCCLFEHVDQRNEGEWSLFVLLEMQNIPLTDGSQVNTITIRLHFNRKMTVKKKFKQDAAGSGMVLHHQQQHIRLSRL